MDLTEKLYHLYIRMGTINKERCNITLESWRNLTIHQPGLPKTMYAMACEMDYKLRELTNLRKIKKELQQTINYVQGN